MKNKKEFFGVLISVLVCAFLVFLGVYAASTIGLDIIVDDDITVSGNNISFGNGASISNTDVDTMVFTESYFDINGTVDISTDLIVQDTIHVGETASDDLDYSRIGTGTTDESGDIDANSDLLVTEDLEVGDNFIVNGTASLSSEGLLLDGGATIKTGIASISGTGCVLGSLFIDTVLGEIHICDEADTYTLISTD